MAIGSSFYLDDMNTASELIFHGPSQDIRNWMKKEISTYTDNIRTIAPAVASSIMDKYNKIHSSEAVRNLNSLKARVRSIWQPNSVRYLSTVEEIQNSPNVMKRWVMAMPMLREKYLLKGISGYEGSYEDNYPGTLGEKHYDYRRVTEGVISKSDDADNASYHIYYENIDKDEDILSIIDKTSITATWAVIQANITSGNVSDPTSVWNGTL
jgi:hypothetical protein